MARAYGGVVAAERGIAMRDMQWEALRQFACGCLPAWEPMDRKAGAKARSVVNEAIGYVQGALNMMVEAWRARAAGGLAWERERGDKAEWLRLVVRAWRREEGVEQRMAWRREEREGVMHVAVEGAEMGREEGERDVGGGNARTEGKRQHSKRRRCGAGRSAAADAMTLAKYVQHVVRPDVAARRGAAAAGRVVSEPAEGGEDRGGGGSGSGGMQKEAGEAGGGASGCSERGENGTLHDGTLHDAVHVDSGMHAVHVALYEADEGGYAAVTMDGNPGISGPRRPPERVRKRFTQAEDGKRHRTRVVHWVEHATVYEIVGGAYKVVTQPAEVSPQVAATSTERLRRVTAAAAGVRTGRKPGIGTNVVRALQRDERLGRSWRGSEEGG